MIERKGNTTSTKWKKPGTPNSRNPKGAHEQSLNCFISSTPSGEGGGGGGGLVGGGGEVGAGGVRGGVVWGGGWRGGGGWGLGSLLKQSKLTPIGGKVTCRRVFRGNLPRQLQYREKI